MKTNRRVGPKMSLVRDFVARNPGLYMIEAASWCAPHGSLRYGYATVHRAVKAGVVKLVPEAKGFRARLYPADGPR